MTGMDKPYQVAVRLISEYLIDLKDMEIGYKFGEEMFNALDLAEAYGDDDEDLIMHVDHAIANDLLDLVSQAINDRNAYDTLIFCGQHLKRRNETLPVLLSDFLLEVALNPNAKPKHVGGQQKTSSHEIDRKKWCLQIAIAQGLKPTRNEASAAISACDAVAEAAKNAGAKGYGFDSMKKLCGELKKDQPTIPYYLKGAISLKGSRR